MPSGRNVLLFFILFLLIPMLPILKTYGATAAIAVDPPVSNVTIGDTFNININVTNIANFTCWQLKLYFLKGVLNCTAAVEGPFLVGPSGTFYGKIITNNFNATHGELLAYATLNGNFSVAGSGTILTVTFKAVGVGNTPLHMANIKLGDEKIPPKDIPYSAFDGTVQVNRAPHDIAVTNITLGKTAIGQGYAGNINVTIENQGNYAETFNVSVYASLAEIATIKNVTLTNGMSTIITFTWNTSGFSKGNYTISASASPVQGETDTTDNNSTDGWIVVTIPGDVGGDFENGHYDVDLYDAVKLLACYGARQGDSNYDPNCDIDNSGQVFLFDAVILLSHYGEKYP